MRYARNYLGYKEEYLKGAHEPQRALSCELRQLCRH